MEIRETSRNAIESTKASPRRDLLALNEVRSYLSSFQVLFTLDTLLVQDSLHARTAIWFRGWNRQEGTRFERNGPFSVLVAETRLRLGILEDRRAVAYTALHDWIAGGNSSGQILPS